jgi:hypothetical protein
MAAPIPATSITSGVAAKGVVGSKACYTAECSPPQPPKYCSKWDKDLNHCVQWNDNHIPRPTLSARDITEVNISGVETDEVDIIEVETIEVDTTKVDAPEVDTTKVDTAKVDTTKVDSHKKLTCDNCFPYFSVSIL